MAHFCNRMRVVLYICVNSHQNMNDIILDVGSIGWGVQSTAILLMQGLGLMPKTDVNFFSELRETQATLDYKGYMEPILKDMGIECITLTPPDIYEHVINWKNDERVSMLPLWFKNEKGEAQPIRRQCTSDFKIEIVAGGIRKHLGVKKLQRHSVRIHQGITTDELRRAKKAGLYPDKKFRVNHYPFIGMYANVTDQRYKWVDYSRQKLIDEIFKKYDFKIPPKSSCFFCPFHDLEYWEEIYHKWPVQWELACALDDKIRNYNYNDSFESGPFYLYKGLIPLRVIDFDKERKKPSSALSLIGCESGFCFI